MSRALDFIRRHTRWFAGVAVLILAAGGAVALGSAGAVHAQTPQTIAKASHTFSAAAGAHTSPRSAAPALVPIAAKTTVRSQTLAHRHAGTSVRPGVPAAPPTSHAVALALRRSTGLTPSQVAVRQLCLAAGARHARCAAEALVLRSDGAFVHPRVARASAGGTVYGDAPAYLQQAYDLSSLAQTGGVGDTVAIVDAYDDPTAESDLGVYRSFYNLPACTTANGCFRKVNENGGSSPPSTMDAGWEREISLDLDAVSAICPNCHILLVEANSTYSTDMQTAMQTAAADGANQISASWTFSSSHPLPGRYTFPGIATVAATGDDGYVEPGQDNFPAALPGVTAAGGTTLTPASATPNARGFTEEAWSEGGSGCATEISKPAYQSDTGCTGRTYADLAADANPETGLAVYDNGTWLEVGGTSLATPIIAAYYAITGVADSSPQWAYGDSGALNDVVSGSDGSNCVPIYICNAGVGYDGPTGVGSISGAAATGAPGIGGTYTESQAAHIATIAGGIYPNGAYTTWSIQYGTTAQYGLQTPSMEVGAGTAPVAVTGYLSQLTPNTTYHYRLVAQNFHGISYGNDYTFTTPAAPPSSPTAAFTPPTAPVPGAAVTFDASTSSAGSSKIQTYAWNFGDGSPVQTTSNPTIPYTYANRGTYTVSLTVTNSAGKADTTTQTITVDNPPTAQLKTPSVTVTTPDTVTVDGSVSTAAAGGVITDYSWNFGDGTTGDTGTTATATHAYAKPGTYTITLTTTDDLALTATATQTVSVAGFTADPSAPTPDNQVTFTAPNPGALSGTITDYSWNFGDGATADTGTSPSATHTFTGRRTYPVSLTVTNSAGQSFTGTETVTVDTPPASPDNADLSTSQTIGSPGQPVSFNGGAWTADTPGYISSYSWNFGDGSAPVSGSSASHTYNAVGTYTATLTVTDDLGDTSSTSQHVVIDQPAAAFTPSSMTLAPNAPGSFDAGASSDPEGTIRDYKWSFGDGSSVDTGDTATTSHSYIQRGNYPVALTVTNNYGQTATTTYTVTVDNAPTAAFSPSATVATAGSTLGFNAGASAAMTGGSIADYSWSFGDGATEDTNTTATATHAYATPGSYTVTLTTTDDLGVSATTSEQVTIESPAPSVPPAQAPTTSARTSPTTPTPTPSPTTPAPNPLSASLTTAKKQRLAPALAHGVRMSLSVSQAVRASFQLTLPVTESRLARNGAKPKSPSIVLLRTRPQTLGAGGHTITLRLSRAAARELAGSGPLTLTVEVTLTESSGVKISRTVKVTLTR